MYSGTNRVSDASVVPFFMFVLDLWRTHLYEYQSDEVDRYIFKVLFDLLISKETKVLKNLLSLKNVFYEIDR